MPIPVLETVLTPEMQKILAQTVDNMHMLARLDLNREAAIEIRQQFSRPIGILASRNGLTVMRTTVTVKESAK